MDNFDLKKYLIENKVTMNSRMLSENQSADAAIDKLIGMGFDEDLLAYVVEDGKVSSINGRDRMIFDHYMDYIFDLAEEHGDIKEVSKHVGTLPTVGGIKPNVKATITFEDGKTVSIAQDNSSEVPKYTDDGNLASENRGSRKSKMMNEYSKPDDISMRLFLDSLGFDSGDDLFDTAIRDGDIYELINMMGDVAGGGEFPFDGMLTQSDFIEAGNAAGFHRDMIEDILDIRQVRTLERG